MRRILVYMLFAVAAAALPLASSAQEPPGNSEEEIFWILDRAKSQAGTTNERALVLARLAWPDGERNPRLAAAARQDLVNFGAKAVPALRVSIRRVKPIYQSDLTAALLEARRMSPAGTPLDFVPALEEIVWFGTSDARRLAIPELTKTGYARPLLAIIDVAYENPELTEMVVTAIGFFHNDRARHFLSEVLERGSHHERERAGRSLARIGNRALGTLRDAVLSDQRPTREAAMGALVEVATSNDLSILQEYVELFPEDDPILASRVRERIDKLLASLESRQQP